MKRYLLTAALALLGGILTAQDAPKADAKPAKAAFVQKPELYPLDTCIVSGEKLDDKAVTFTAGGSTFKTCCEKCQAKVEKDVATYQKKLEAATVAAQAGHYPLATCVISGGKLGEMGEPVKLVLDGTYVQLCCSHCTDKAKAAAPAMATKVREAAYAAQLKTYPLDTCIVGGEKLGDGAVSVMFGTTLVRFCCEKCVAKFEASPAQYLAKFHPPAKGDKPAEQPKTGK